MLAILMSEGWMSHGQFAFKKDGYELVFDTSSYVELYELSSGKRVHESKIIDSGDMSEFLKQIDI
ncbi:MAG: hypothetical protein AAF593_05845 [Planctomycetota bacterium]